MITDTSGYKYLGDFSATPPMAFPGYGLPRMSGPVDRVLGQLPVPALRRRGATLKFCGDRVMNIRWKQVRETRQVPSTGLNGEVLYGGKSVTIQETRKVLQVLVGDQWENVPTITPEGAELEDYL